jgi:amino acid adenylation domain-containing protein
MLLVADFIERIAQRNPNKTAIVCGDARTTYAELDAISNQLAWALIDRGVKRGDRVVLFLPNSLEMVAGIFAAAKADAVFVPVNHSTRPAKFARLVEDCRPTAIVAPAAKAATLSELAVTHDWLKTLVLVGGGTEPNAGAENTCLRLQDVRAEYPETQPPRHAIDRDLACLIYTSGSSGTPKGVMSTHANVAFAASSVIAYHENVSDDVILCALPLSFDYGLYQVLMAAKFGGTVVLEPSFAYPAAILKRMEAEGVTGFPGVPTMFALLMRTDLTHYDLSRLRYMTNTGAALPPAHIARLREMLPHTRIYSSYGLTETKRTLYLPPDQLEKRPGSVGIAIPGTEVWLEDEDGRRVGGGETGELVIRGGHVMQGYWDAPELTAQRYRPGPLPGERVCYSGDLFRMDGDGYFYFVGRKDDIIKSRGEKVSPKEVEDVLYEMPAIAEAAVIGVPDAILGHAIKALVVTRHGELNKKDVLRHCRAHLEDYMLPKYVEFVDELPKSANGKIQKPAVEGKGGQEPLSARPHGESGDDDGKKCLTLSASLTR